MLMVIKKWKGMAQHLQFIRRIQNSFHIVSSHITSLSDLLHWRQTGHNKLSQIVSFVRKMFLSRINDGFVGKNKMHPL